MVEIKYFLEKRKKACLLRALRPLSLRNAGKIRIQGKDYIDFSSNDYLGLSGHPKLKEAAKKAIDKFGVGACASRLMSGDLELHHQLEDRAAQFKNKEAALVFNSGYQANVGILSSLYGKGDAIFSDRLNHASIIDGIILSGVKFFRFRHNDAGHLKELLKKERVKFKNALIITETVFSMDGDRAPLKELVRLKKEFSCRLMVDEAHATGIFGKRGSGIVEEEGLEGQVDLLMGTFSKALGSFGAYLAGPKDIIDYLINTARSFIYSTALPPAVIAVNLEAIQLTEDDPGKRKALLENADYFRNALAKAGLEVRGASQIVPLVVGENTAAQEYSAKLKEKGFWVLPIRPPTVPQGQARLRFSLTANHNKETLERLIDEILRLGI